MSESQLHELEVAFGLPAREILEVILHRPRCLMAVRGAVAESYLDRVLRQLQAQGKIDSYQEGGEGQPDFYVQYTGHSKAIRIECKNVQKANSTDNPITIDFWRTRAPRSRRKTDTNEEPLKGQEGRYYKPDEFEAVAACLYRRTGKWEFRYARISDFKMHSVYKDRIDNHVTVQLEEGPIWKKCLTDVLKAVVDCRSARETAAKTESESPLDNPV